MNKILGTIHIYPTLAEANKYAAGVWRRACAAIGRCGWRKGSTPGGGVEAFSAVAPVFRLGAGTGIRSFAWAWDAPAEQERGPDREGRASQLRYAELAKEPPVLKAYLDALSG
jgi:hypothetical protein